MRTVETRLAFIDALKAIASQLIVLHHLAFYGPMSDVAQNLAPALFTWLSQDARIAVQLFLVISGFLAAKTLAPTGQLIATKPLSLIGRRYYKLAIPYVTAVLVSILCAAIARRLMDNVSIPGPPSLVQFAAHIALLQNILHFDSLSAGVWYIAIDFQLFVLLLGTLWVVRSTSKRIRATHILGVALVSGLVLASLFYFNRDPNWDNWALYFFGAYGLGVVTFWATENGNKRVWLLSIAGLVVAALIVDFRSRIAVALITALALGLARRWGFLASWPKSSLLAYLGKISYSVFLTHFPVILIINAVFSRTAPDNPAVNAIGILFAWTACTASGTLFYHFIEKRANR
jgi:peptidoglycan/LPS O-acetylase OafA/YrhL